VRASPPRRLQATAFAGMFLYGIAAALLGATLPLLSERLEIGLGRVGTLFLVLNGCMLASSFALGSLQDRHGMKPQLVAGPLVVGAALLAVAGAERYAQLLPAVALLGVGGTAINSASNTLVADLFPDPAAKTAALNRVGLFFGIGALLIPLLIGLLLRAAGLGWILVGAAGLCACVAAANAMPAYPPAKHAGGLSLAQSARFARDPLVLRLGLLLFFQSGNEFILGGFSTTFLTSELGMSVRAASYALSGFWGALMLTRTWLGRGPSALTAERLILLSAGASAVVTALLVTAPGPLLAVAAVVALGATVAGIFPAVLGVAASRFPAHSGSVFGILFTMALSGGMTLPWITGQAAAARGLRPALALVVLQFLAVAALSWSVTAGRERLSTASSR
jgi:FHS family glucose/mannose:H+ symporter-like MFS transporter